MNRKIKFRAYIPDVGMRVVHHFENEAGTKRLARLAYRDHPSERTAKIKGYVTICLLGDIKVMQYTGLKDKNDKEIYEGDIIYIAGVGNCEVKRDGRMRIFRGKDRDVEPHDAYMENDVEEIIGNIYENPELLL